MRPRMPDSRAPVAPRRNCVRYRTSKHLRRRRPWLFARSPSMSTCVDAHVALGTVLFLRDWDWPAAERSLRRALALDPAHTEGLVQYGALDGSAWKAGRRPPVQAAGARAQPTVALAAGADCDLVHWHQRKHNETLVWAERALALDPTHLLAMSLLSFVHSRRGDLVNLLEENLRGAPPPGMPDEALTTVRQIVAEMRSVQTTEGISGVTRYMADAVNDPRVEFDGMLKLASRRAILFGDASRLDDAFDYLDQAIAGAGSGTRLSIHRATVG